MHFGRSDLHKSYANTEAEMAAEGSWCNGIPIERADSIDSGRLLRKTVMQ